MQHEDAGITGLCRQPHEGQARKGGFDQITVVAHIDQQDAIRREMGFCRLQYAAQDVVAVITRREGKLRLVAKLLWQHRHAFSGDVGRIADD